MNKRIKKKKLKKLNHKIDMVLKDVFRNFIPFEEDYDLEQEIQFSKEHREKMNELFDRKK